MVLIVGLIIVSVIPMWDVVSSAEDIYDVEGCIEEERFLSGSGDVNVRT